MGCGSSTQTATTVGTPRRNGSRNTVPTKVEMVPARTPPSEALYRKSPAVSAWETLPTLCAGTEENIHHQSATCASGGLRLEKLRALTGSDSGMFTPPDLRSPASNLISPVTTRGLQLPGTPEARDRTPNLESLQYPAKFVDSLSSPASQGIFDCCSETSSEVIAEIDAYNRRQSVGSVCEEPSLIKSSILTTLRSAKAKVACVSHDTFVEQGPSIERLKKIRGRVYSWQMAIQHDLQQ